MDTASPNATEQAASVFAAVQAKIDDYFTRSRLVSFDRSAEAFLNPGETDYTALALKTLSATTEELAAFPLVRVAADQPLSLSKHLNPGWSAAGRSRRSRRDYRACQKRAPGISGQVRRHLFVGMVLQQDSPLPASRSESL